MPTSRAEAAAVVAALGLAPKGDPLQSGPAASSPPSPPRPTVRPPLPPPAYEAALALAASALAGVAAAAAPARDAGRVAVSETRRFAGKEVAVTKLVAPAAAAATASTSDAADAVNKAGMDAVLASLAGGPKKVTAVDKTRSDWTSFKRTAATVHDELDAYKKSGGAHVARLAFLKKAELAQYEQERDARLRGDVRNRGRL